MVLKASPASSLLGTREEALVPRISPLSYPNSPFLTLRFSPERSGAGFSVCAASKEAENLPLTGVVFEHFEEVKKELDLVPTVPQVSLARQRYSDECEAAINAQIYVDCNASYAYHAMFSYFDRDNVGLRGLAKCFKESSEEERERAEKLMEYQNKRGGRVRLRDFLIPRIEYDHEEKGDALYAMEVALNLEKLINERLLNLHGVTARNNDAQLADFIESEFLDEQVATIKKISEYVAQLRRVGKGHGVWHFAQRLLHKGEGL